MKLISFMVFASVAVGAAIGVSIAGGCAGSPLDGEYWPPASPLGRDTPAMRVARDPDDAGERPDIPQPTGALSLPEVLALTLQHSPMLAEYAWEIRAREAQIIQANLWSNPEFEFELEGFGGSGPAAGFDGSETTLAIGQPLLLGGKIEKRTDLARLERDLAGWDYEAARVATFTSAASDFINMLIAQRRLEIARETLQLANRIYSNISERVNAGKISPVERTKSNVEVARARLDYQRAERSLVIARHRLAANWGSDSPTFDEVTGDLARLRNPPEFAELLELVENNPDLARWSSEMASRRAAIELALAEAVPDLTVMGGIKLIEGGDDTTFVIGASIPIPIFDRNQGGILESKIRLAQSDRTLDASRVRVRSDLAIAAQELKAAYDEVLAVRDEILPSSQSAFEATEEAFRQGKINALDLLDSERTLFAARTQYIEALGQYHLAVIAVERLIGSPIEMAVEARP